MRKKGIILILLLLSVQLFSEIVTITEETAIELAVKSNIDLQKQNIEEQSALIEKKSSYNIFYPKSVVSGAISRSNTTSSQTVYVSSNDSHVTYTPDNTNLALKFESGLYLTPSMIDSIKLLNSFHSLEALESQQKEDQVIRDVKKSFYTLILLKEQIKLYSFFQDELEKRYLQVKKNYDNGYVDELQVLEVQVALENLKPEINNLTELYSISIKNFKNQIGLDQRTEIELSGVIEIKDTDYLEKELLPVALANGYDMKILNQNIEIIDEQLELKKHSTYYPVLGVSYSMSTALNDPFNSDNWSTDNYLDDMGSFNLSLSMDFAPLLPNSREITEMKKLKNSKKIALLSKKQLTDGIDLMLNEKVQSLNNSLELQDSLNYTVALAQKRLELTRVAFNQGTKEALEVETAENELRKAQLELLNEKYNYLISIFDIEFIIGERV